MDKPDPKSPPKRLRDILTERCKTIISNIENSVDASSPRDCLTLWSYMGELEYLQGRPTPDQGTLDSSTTGVLRERLVKLIGTQGSRLGNCLFAGINETLSRLDHELQKTKGYYLSGGLGPKLTSYEANDGLLGLRDRLGFAELFVRSVNFPFFPSAQKQIDAEDELLKSFLPQAIKQFRDNNDDPTPHPENFPREFWWRQLEI